MKEVLTRKFVCERRIFVRLPPLAEQIRLTIGHEICNVGKTTTRVCFLKYMYIIWSAQDIGTRADVDVGRTGPATLLAQASRVHYWCKHTERKHKNLVERYAGLGDYVREINVFAATTR